MGPGIRSAEREINLLGDYDMRKKIYLCFMACFMIHYTPTY